MSLLIPLRDLTRPRGGVNCGPMPVEGRGSPPARGGGGRGRGRGKGRWGGRAEGRGGEGLWEEMNRW